MTIVDKCVQDILAHQKTGDVPRTFEIPYEEWSSYNLDLSTFIQAVRDRLEECNYIARAIHFERRGDDDAVLVQQARIAFLS